MLELLENLDVYQNLCPSHVLSSPEDQTWGKQFEVEKVLQSTDCLVLRDITQLSSRAVFSSPTNK